MRILRPTVLALTLTLMLSPTVLAGNIGGLRTSGNIGGMQTSGNIAGLRNTGNIGGTRSATVAAPRVTVGDPRIALETNISGTFAALIRMLLESGALL
jgi:hypothetical protein